jgi:glycosidase
MAVLLQATLPGAPCVYYGDELGLEGGNDPDCRRSFPDESAWDRELLDFVAAALRLRAAEPALRRGGWRIAGAAGDAAAIERMHGGARLVVGLNAGVGPARLAVDVPDGGGRRLEPVPLPGWSPRAATVGPDGSSVLDLPPRVGGLWRLT